MLFLTSCEKNKTRPSVSDNKAIQSDKKQSKIPEEEEEISNHFPDILEYDSSRWINIAHLEPEIKLDIRYATTRNFVGDVMYDCGKCFLRPEVAQAVVKIHSDLKSKGYGGLKIFDCYRPKPYQQRLWDRIPDQRYVSPPDKGSMHTRGAAVDLTIVDKEGNELDMGTDFDYFGKEAYHGFEHPEEIIKNRNLLKSAMYKRGFKHIRTEWWHYSYTIRNYSLSEWVWPCNNE